VVGERETFQAEFEYSFSLAEISRCCQVPAEKILVLVSEGVLSPCGRTQHDWRFASGDLVRALSVLRLERDLGVNTAGAALAIDLMDEMQRLRERVRLLEKLTFQR